MATPEPWNNRKMGAVDKHPVKDESTTAAPGTTLFTGLGPLESAPIEPRSVKSRPFESTVDYSSLREEHTRPISTQNATITAAPAKHTATEVSSSSSDASSIEKSQNPTDSAPEVSKVALKRWPRLGTFLLQFLGLATTFVLFYLNFKPVYWFDIDSNGDYYLPSGTLTSLIQNQFAVPYNDFLKALLLAGKAHEILLAGSLSAVVLHFTRSKLLSRRGLPLGMLSAGNRQWDYLVTRGFIQTILSERVLAAFLVFCAIVSVLLGPASNALMQPSLAWWPVANPYDGNQLQVYVDANRSTLWPEYISTDYIPNSNCYQHDAQSAPFECPSAGFASLYNWVISNSQTGNNGNLTLMDPVTEMARPLLSDSGIPTLNQNTGVSNGMAIASTLTAILARTIGAFAIYVSQNPNGPASDIARPKFTADGQATPISSPLVTVSCNVYDYEDIFTSPDVVGRPSFPFPNTTMFNSTSTYTSADSLLVPQELWNFTRSLDAVNFTWIDTWNLGQENSSRTSLGGLWTIPYNDIHHDPTTHATNVTQRSMLAPCSVDARWAGVQMWNDPDGDRLVGSNITDPLAYLTGDSRPVSEMLRIDPLWAAQLNGWTMAFTDNSLNAYGNFSAMEALARAFIVNSTIDNVSTFTFTLPFNGQINVDLFTQAVASTLAMGVGAVVGEGLARLNADRNIILLIGNDTTSPDANVTVTNLVHQVGAGYQTYTALVNNFTNPTSQWLGLSFTVQRWGYSWGLKSILSKLAVASLATHALIIILFALYLVTFSKWGTSAWDDISDLLVLALNSHPTHELDGTCAGAASARVLRSRVGIREVLVGEGHLELVVTSGVDGALPGAVPVVRKSYG